MNDLQKANEQQMVSVIESIVLNGDLSKLNSQQKVLYYNAFCEKLGLNPLTKPFQLIKFQGKEILYATKDATEQLRKINGISIFELEKLFQDGLYIVTAKAEDKNGRKDAATGALSINGLKGDALANAIMKCESKAKRRVTLSICGLGVIDDSETETLGNYSKMDITSGDVIETKNTPSENQQQPQLPPPIKQEKASKTKTHEELKIPEELDKALRSFSLGMEGVEIFTVGEIKDQLSAIRDLLIKEFGKQYTAYINQNLLVVYQDKMSKIGEK